MNEPRRVTLTDFLHLRKGGEKTKTEKIEEKKARAHIFSVYDVTKYIKQRLD